MPVPKVSILVPTLRGARDLERLVPALDAQRGDFTQERIAVDSSSDDDTVSKLEAGGFQVRTIERSEFGHGRTRNLLASLATGEFLLFLSQDAVPIGESFIADMLRPFDDESVAGVTARVLPFQDDDPLTARTVLTADESSPISETRRASDVAALGPVERARLFRFNNIASCIRASVHREIPFPEVPFGEDFAWAARAIARGHGVHSTGEAAVRHAHRYGPRAAHARYREDAVFHREYFGRAVRPTLFSVLKGAAHEVRDDVAFLVRGDVPGGHGRAAGWRAGAPTRALALLKSPILRIAQVLGQYSARSGSDSRWDAARAAGALEIVPGKASHDESIRG